MQSQNDPNYNHGYDHSYDRNYDHGYDHDYDQILKSRVHPKDYINPKPSQTYHLVVIGAGAAGLVVAAGAAGLGAKVALIEKSFLGGDCLNFGCVPSKAILASARFWKQLKKANDFGISGLDLSENSEIDFDSAMNRMRRLRSEMSIHDSVKRFSEMGVDVFFGQAEFVDSNCIKVDEAKIKFSKAVICSGSRPAIPNIHGLDSISYLTNETLFSLRQIPKRLGIIGGGPIGCEMAQAFARFGSEVSLILGNKGLLPKEDRDASAIVEKSLVADAVKIFGHGKELAIRHTNRGLSLYVNSAKHGYEIEVDHILVAVGRTPNVEGMNLKNIGVNYTSKGIVIDDFFQTTNPKIYAAGDVCSPYQFTHAADFMARAVIRNALFKGRIRHSKMIFPWCTYTSPELAQIGLTSKAAAQKGIAIDTFTQAFSGIDRAILEGQTDGFARVHVRKGTEKIIGSTIVSSNAGEMIGVICLAMTHKIGLGKFSNLVLPYPTLGEAIRKLGDAYQKTRLTPRLKSLLSKWLQWTH